MRTVVHRVGVSADKFHEGQNLLVSLDFRDRAQYYKSVEAAQCTLAFELSRSQMHLRDCAQWCTHATWEVGCHNSTDVTIARSRKFL